ncbi:heterokaryon incompatibility protein-domain-containing protein, partial [Pisolithus marmoratus]
MRDLGDTVTDHYAILSHRWVADEVGYTEMMKLPKMEVRGSAGYQKIVNSCHQAKIDGLKWLWVDTCCIDQRNSSELQAALTSMFGWYANSKTCYAYLHDVDVFPTSPDTERLPRSRGWPEWFSRCWTLGEMIAPRNLRFFNRDWKPIGDKRTHASILEKITRVPSEILQDGLARYPPSIAQVMSWAADREATRIEDCAYSLMGLLGVNMPMFYGEGKEAFQRLQLAVMQKSNDQTIFAW